MHVFKWATFVMLAALFCAGRSQAGPGVPVRQPQKVAISGDLKYKPHTLVRLKADGVDAKAGVVWRVYPSANVSRASTARTVLEFVAPPGTYQVELLVIKTGPDGAIDVEEQSTAVEIENCCDKAPPVPPQSPEPKPLPKTRPDPVNALGRIQFGTSGCTATVIGPRRSDGRWNVLTAAHCMGGVGQRGTMKLKDGRTLKIQVVSRNETSDHAWCVTDETFEDVAYAEIATANPAPGVAIWHQGYGVDKPGNREEGVIVTGQDSNGQLRMELSVSSGDSGGGIFRADTGELVSVVCCTSRKGFRAAVWGCAAAEVANKTRPKSGANLPPGEDTITTADWTPIEIPTVTNWVNPK